MHFEVMVESHDPHIVCGGKFTADSAHSVDCHVKLSTTVAVIWKVVTHRATFVDDELQIDGRTLRTTSTQLPVEIGAKVNPHEEFVFHSWKEEKKKLNYKNTQRSENYVRKRKSPELSALSDNNGLIHLAKKTFGSKTSVAGLLSKAKEPKIFSQFMKIFFSVWAIDDEAPNPRSRLFTPTFCCDRK